MNTNICAHKQPTISSNFQKSWEDAPNYSFKKTCVKHTPKTLKNNPQTNVAKTS